MTSWGALAMAALTASAGGQQQAMSRDHGAMATGPHNVIISGVRVWYSVAGASANGIAPVVFLHGGPGYNSYSFAAMAGPALERKLRMVYYDQRGAGRSERPWNHEYSISLLVDDIEGLRRTLGVPQISLIGHSFGGLLALEYAAKYPSHVSRVVLVSAASDLPAACGARVAWLAEHRSAELARARADTSDTHGQPNTDCALSFKTLTDSQGFQVYNHAVMFPDSSIGIRLDSVDAASGLQNTGEQQQALFAHGLVDYRFASPNQLTMPVLVLAGRHDSAIGLTQQTALARSLPDARIVVYERGGHFLYLDEPERFTSDVVAFLSGQSGARR